MSKNITFSNGLRLWVKPMKTTRSLSMGVFVHAGSMNENDDNNGIAHFIEHMVFKGTKNRSAFQIVEEMERSGIQINAFTTKSFTAFYTVSIDEYSQKCMEMLADLYYNPTMKEEHMEKEKKVVLEEISMYEDDPESLCMELLCQAHYGDDLISRPILGTAETVNNFTVDTINDFRNKYYRPDSTLISVVGNITVEEAKALVEKYFDINTNHNLPSIITKKRGQPRKQFLYRVKDIEQANVGISFPSFCIAEKQSSISNIIAGMLGGGMSSRLFQRVREELGLVYNIYANDIQYVVDGFMSIFFATNPASVGQALIAIREVILQLLKEGFSDDELAKSKAQYKSAIILAAESSAYLMRAGGKFGLLMGQKYDLNKRLKVVEAITQDDLNETLQAIFDIESASISYVGKEIEKDLLTLFTKGDIDEQTEKAV